MKSFLVLVALAGSVFAAPAPYPLNVNSRNDSAPGVLAFRGNESVFRATFTDGAAVSDLTNCTPFMQWSTSNTASITSTSTWAFVGNTASGIVDFTFSPSSVNYAPGRYIYEIGVKTGAVPRTYRQGVFTIQGSPVGQGVAAVNWSTNVNWNSITWQNLPAFSTNAGADTLARSGIVAVSGRVDTAASGIVAETNRAIQAESGINSTATNSLALALANATPSGVSNIIASVASTGTYHFASTAGGLAITNGYVSLTIVGDVMTIIKTTNTTAVIVTATNNTGSGYNGPILGTVFINPVFDVGGWWAFDPVATALDGEWRFQLSFAGADLFSSTSPTIAGEPFDGSATITFGGSDFPGSAAGAGGALGTLTLDWVPHTTTNTYDLSQFVTGAVLNGSAVAQTNGTLYIVDNDSMYVSTNDAKYKAAITNGQTGISSLTAADMNATTVATAPIFKDRDNQNYYLDAYNSTLSAFLNGPVLTLSGKIYLGSTNCWLFTNGTNLYFRNVNNVTNAITVN